MATPLVAPPLVKAKALFCPNCGGPVELRGFGHAITVVCPQCLSVLDASTPLLKVLQQAEEAQRPTLKIPLGTRGKLSGVEWEVIGYQTRGVQDVDTSYAWDEYLLFNPYKGFRYLTEYQGHWNFVTPLEPMPARRAVGGRPAVWFEGRTFKHFSGAEAITAFVLGEFPWRVKVGEKVIADDFIDPPAILSSEKTEDEITWSKGEYTTGADIWKAFKLPGSAPSPDGVFLNQPSPYHGRVGGIWGTFGWAIAMLAALAIFFAVLTRQRVVFNSTYHFSPADQGEPSFVTPVFELDGTRDATLELDVNTNLTNDWAYFNFALINSDTGAAFDFGREVSYYTGRDSDGAWTEGGSTSTVLIPSVPPGRYYLRVEPEMETGIATSRRASLHNVDYQIVLRHDVPSYAWFWIAASLLLVPPVAYTIRARSFEKRRWMESDYPPARSRGD
ncbi:MAG: hypothetical protein DMG59_15405 [Acidobacteria bacterium]|nr:MAG: hypothetical protein DMG59_15405 [Acidobacteriota bacterium]